MLKKLHLCNVTRSQPLFPSLWPECPCNSKLCPDVWRHLIHRSRPCNMSVVYFEMCAVARAAAVKLWVAISFLPEEFFIISVRSSLREIMSSNADFPLTSTNISRWGFLFRPFQCTHITLKFIFTYILLIFHPLVILALDFFLSCSL